MTLETPPYLRYNLFSQCHLINSIRKCDIIAERIKEEIFNGREELELGNDIEHQIEELKRRDEAEKKLEAVKEELKSVGLKVSVKIPEGIPFKKILRIAEDEDVSLIVLGSHGKSNIREMLLGSVSEKVVRGSKRPVLVIKRETTIMW